MNLGTYSPRSHVILLSQLHDLLINQQRGDLFAFSGLAQRRISSQDDTLFPAEFVQRHLREIRVAFDLIDRWGDLGCLEEGREVFDAEVRDAALSARAGDREICHDSPYRLHFARLDQLLHLLPRLMVSRRLIDRDRLAFGVLPHRPMHKLLISP